MGNCIASFISGLLAAPILGFLFYEGFIYGRLVWGKMYKCRAKYLAYEERRAKWNAERAHELQMQELARYFVGHLSVMHQQFVDDPLLWYDVRAILETRYFPVRSYRSHYAIETLRWLPYDIRRRWLNKPWQGFIPGKEWMKARDRATGMDNRIELDMFDRMVPLDPPEYTPM